MDEASLGLISRVKANKSTGGVDSIEINRSYFSKPVRGVEIPKKRKKEVIRDFNS